MMQSVVGAAEREPTKLWMFDTVQITKEQIPESHCLISYLQMFGFWMCCECR